ncbi:MAG: hypothetical protein CVU48_01155 [Candidatus Cloacimonetes bacterium HGW-Cloacimonetes-1]|jgi:GTPase SAR1 family protein|nr:MAG: hypothetical protein CVU48_01155 [Candidatus Cloacimonetes bacterium HGW-Cloacimonetes-1]
MNTYLDSHEGALELIRIVLSTKTKEVPGNQDRGINDLRKFVYAKLLPHLNEASPENSSDLVDAFQMELERFEAFAAFPEFESKHLIGVGGAFSSGKSMLLNTLMGDKILPTKINPSTVVPTFLMHSVHEEVGVVNKFNVRCKLDLQGIKAIGYEFSDKYEIELGYLINKAFVAIPAIPYKHIALLDTPGYSKPDSNQYSDRTDEKVAREQLITADSVIWVMDIENGTLKENDINFIRTLRLGRKPLLMVLSKAEKLNHEDVENVQKEVAKCLQEMGFEGFKIIPFSAKKRDLYPITPICEWLSNRDVKKDISSFPKNFKRIFSEFRRYYEKEKDEARRRIDRSKQTAFAILDIDKISSECINDIVMEAKNVKTSIEDLEKKLSKLQRDFFALLKKIGDSVGIKLPEPDEVDMISEDAANAHDLFKGYLEKKDIKDSSINEYILEGLSGLHQKPVKTSGPLSSIIETSPEVHTKIWKAKAHPLVSTTESIRADYLTLLTVLARQDGEVRAEEAMFLGSFVKFLRIGNIDTYHRRVNKLSAADLATCLKSIRQSELSSLLLLDAILLCLTDKDISKQESIIMGMMAEALNISKETANCVVQLAHGIIKKDEKQLFAYQKTMMPIPIDAIQALYIDNWINPETRDAMIASLAQALAARPAVKSEKKKKATKESKAKINKLRGIESSFPGREEYELVEAIKHGFETQEPI